MIPVANLDELMAAARDKKSVVVPKAAAWERPRPAAFMINQIGNTLYHLFQVGMFIHEPVAKRPFRPIKRKEGA